MRNSFLLSYAHCIDGRIGFYILFINTDVQLISIQAIQNVKNNNSSAPTQFCSNWHGSGLLATCIEQPEVTFLYSMTGNNEK